MKKRGIATILLGVAALWPFIAKANTADFIADSVCLGSITTLTSTSTASSGTIVAFNWDLDTNGDFADASGAGLTNIFNQSGLIMVGLQIITSLNDTAFVYKPVIVHHKPVADFDVTDVCLGNPTKFPNNSTIADGSALLYAWDLGGQATSTLENPEAIFPMAGSWPTTLWVASDKGCMGNLSKTGFVYTNPVATIVAEGPVAFCDGGSVNLTGEVDINADSSFYLWSTGFVANTIEATVSDEYIITIVDQHNCIARDTLEVTVHPIPELTITTTETIKAGDQLQLSAVGAASYSWSPVTALDDPASPTPLASPLETTTYTVTAFSNEGCETTAEVIITVIDELEVDNAFTPNGDGVNDFWQIRDHGVIGGCKVTIFNRWSDKVFETVNYNNDWDGKHGNKLLPAGAYYYVIQCDDTGAVFKGTVNIVH